MTDYNQYIIVKGDQSKIIDLIIEKHQVLSEHKDKRKICDLIRCGMCYALSMEWLRSVHLNINEWMSGFGSTEHYLTGTNDTYYLQIASNFASYARLDQQGVRAALTEEFGENMRHEQFQAELLKLFSGGLFSGFHLVGKASNAPNEMALKLCNQSNLFSIGVKFAQGGHRVAAYCDEENKTFYFYDPNFGVTKVEAKSLDDLQKKVEMMFAAWIDANVQVGLLVKEVNIGIVIPK